MIRVYALINHMNIHENLNMLWYIGAKVLWCSELSEVSHAWLHKHAFDLDNVHDMVDEHDEYAWLISWCYAWMFRICLMLMPYNATILWCVCCPWICVCIYIYIYLARWIEGFLCYGWVWDICHVWMIDAC